MIHGFSGSPASIRPWAEALHASGFTVRAPRLPGHGTSWIEMNETRWQDWFSEVEKNFTQLRQSSERVFVAGFSMGGALTLKLASIYGREMEGLLLVNPSISDRRLVMKLVPVLKYFVPSIAGKGSDVAAPNPPRHSYGRTPLKALHSLQDLWSQVQRSLHLIDLPLMIGYSLNDHVVSPENSEEIIDGVASADIREVIFERSFHNVALDYDLQHLIDESLLFIRDVLSGGVMRVNQDEEALIDSEFESIIAGLSLDQSSDRSYLDELEEREIEEESYKTDVQPLPKLSQIQRGALAGVIGGPAYSAIVSLGNFDPLGLGIAPGLIALAAGMVTFFWQLRPENPDGDGVAI